MVEGTKLGHQVSGILDTTTPVGNIDQWDPASFMSDACKCELELLGQVEAQVGDESLAHESTANYIGRSARPLCM